MKSGKQVWETKLIDVAKGTKGFTGAPLVVKDKVIVGSNGGELAGCCGPIFGGRRPHREEGLAVRHDRRRRTLARKLGQRQLEDRRRRRLDDRHL